ncbi:hypothetical protein ACGE0T_14355 [Parabacteroides sp. APC149_11_2_Y6]
MVNNPRHPHNLQVLREQIDSEGNIMFDEEGNPLTEVVFESVCRIYPTGKSRYLGEVVTSDYTISLPLHDFYIKPGYFVKVTTPIRVLSGVVVDSYVNNIGANIWFNITDN